MIPGAALIAALLVWIAAGILVPLVFAPSEAHPEPINADSASRPMRGLGWLYPVAFAVAVLASMAWPAGFAS